MDKVHENLLRRMADRQGMRLVKSRRRDPRAWDYGGYWLVDAYSTLPLVGPISLEEVEEWLTKDREPTQ